jgi:polyisoprenoid-binding protein YceI
MKKLLLLVLIALMPAITFAQTTWNPVTYTIGFKIKNAGLNVNGKFTGLKTELKFDANKPEAGHLKASIEVPTIKTGINKRDKDLQDENYFNVEKYKLIEVNSVKLYYKGNAYAGLFDVTIKGVTKQIEIPFEFSQFADEATFKGSFTVNRSDFGIGGKTLTMSDHAEVNIEIKAKK